MVKALDSKSSGVSPRRFKSCSQRSRFPVEQFSFLIVPESAFSPRSSEAEESHQNLGERSIIFAKHFLKRFIQRRRLRHRDDVF